MGISDLDTLVAALELEQIDTYLFRGYTPGGRERRVYGGQVIAQSLYAAARTLAGDRRVHSLHAYFLRPGDPKGALIFDVDPIRDGKRFSTRNVVVRQAGKAIFSAMISFQIREPGLEHQLPMPQVPAPEGLISDTERRQRTAAKNGEPVFIPIDYRPIRPLRELIESRLADGFGVWMKTEGRLGDDPAIHQALAAYMSDNYLMSTALFTHGRRFDDPDLQTASIDHSLWFYGDFRADDWLYYALQSARSEGGRGHNIGYLYTREGRMIAAAAQEGLMRLAVDD